MNLLMISLSACKFTYIVHSVHLIHLVHLVHVVCLSTLIFVFTLWGMWIEISEMEEKPNLKVSNVAQHSPGKVFPATFRRVWFGDSIDWSDSKCSLIQIPCLKMIECSECRFLCSKFSAEIVSPRLEILLNCFFLFLKRGAKSDSTISEVQDTRRNGKGECPKPYHWQWLRLVINFCPHPICRKCWSVAVHARQWKGVDH